MLTETNVPRRVSRVVDRPRAGAGLQPSLRDDCASFGSQPGVETPGNFR